MPILFRISCIALLLLMSSCIGSSLHRYGDSNSLVNGDTQTDAELNQRLVGMTKDQLIIKYGPANRSAKLEDGTKLMQYNRKSTSIDSYGNRSHDNCELRLWMRDNIVHHVDYRGDQTECILFTSNGRTNVTYDLRTKK
jgi:hypothetical protein